MAVGPKRIREWIERCVQIGATHVIVVYDAFSDEDYPVYVMQHESIDAIVNRYQRSSMQRVMEIYNLSKSIEEQLNEYRAWNM